MGKSLTDRRFPLQLTPMNFKHATRISLGTLLALLLGLTPLSSIPADAQSFPLSTCHIEMGKPKPILGTLSWHLLVPNCTAEKWSVFLANAPWLPGQIKPQTALVFDRLREETTVVLDLSPAKRQLLHALITDSDDKHLLSLQARYQVMLVPRRLVEGRSNSPVTPLTNAERQQYLSASEHINFNEPVFQRWLDTRALRKKQESDLAFAWRTFLTIRNAYKYRYSDEQNRRIAKLCQENSTDCGGLSWLFVGVLRANGVPARSLVGRMAKPESAPGSNLEGAHVRAEFYATGVGWIPVEMSGATSRKAADPLLFFGKDDGDLVTFHVDPDFVLDTKLFGKHAVRLLQNPVFWVMGPGKLDGLDERRTWKVVVIPSY